MGEAFDVNADLVIMSIVWCRHTVSHRGRQYPARSNGFALPVKTPMSTGGEPAATQRIVRPVPPYERTAEDRTTKDGTTIAWPTTIQSGTPDGQFGPAKQMVGWEDCWFLATLAAVANNEQGRQILAGSIKQVTVEGIRGYAVTFKGSPNHPVFISEQTLAHCVDKNGGDADTRLIELAADRFFAVNGRFISLYTASLLKKGMNQDEAEQCVNHYFRANDIRDPKRYNPMRGGCLESVAFFMLTGIYPDTLSADTTTRLQTIDIVAYLSRYAAKNRNGTSIVIAGVENPLGSTEGANRLVAGWDAIRTGITANGTVDAQEQAFLKALDRWLGTPDDTAWRVLRSAAKNLQVQHISPVKFLALLSENQIALRPNHRARLRYGVQEVLGGGPGHIGFPGDHCETIEQINAAQNTFTYSDPGYPTVAHTAELSSLIRAAANGHVLLTALDPATRQDEAESSHAGEKRGRHLLALHHRAVKNGAIDPAEIDPLANLLAMDAGIFRHVYDSDHNGVIQGGELKAVQLRVDRRVNRLTLTPIW